MLLDVVQTNIINVTADAIVLPANEHLKEGSGTSRAIFEAAGRKKLTKACKELGHCSVGSAMPTRAFDIENAKYIIHAVVPKWIDGKHNEYDLLSSAYLASMNIADIMGCKSIAFPLLASGNNKFNKDLAVHIAEESIRSFEGTNLQKVYLVVYGDAMGVYMKGLGYNVIAIPENILKEKNKIEQQVKADKLLSDGKEAAQKMLEDQIEKALEWVKEPANQKKIIDFGVMIVQMVVFKRSPVRK